MKAYILGCLVVLCSLRAHASLKLNISIIHKKGVSKELVLTSELHASEMAEVGNPVLLTMNNGLQYRFWANFTSTIYEYGPSALLDIRGEIIDRVSKVPRPLEETDYMGRKITGPVYVQLGSEKYFTFDDHEGQRIEIIVRPWMI